MIAIFSLIHLFLFLKVFMIGLFVIIIYIRATISFYVMELGLFQLARVS